MSHSTGYEPNASLDSIIIDALDEALDMTSPPRGGAVPVGDNDTGVLVDDSSSSSLVRISSQSETPQRASLRRELHCVEEIAEREYNAMQTQNANFRRMAKEFEQHARDVNERELAHNTASLEAQARDMLSLQERRSQQSMQQQRTTFVAEAREALGRVLRATGIHIPYIYMHITAYSERQVYISHT